MPKNLQRKAGILVADPENGGKIAGVHLPTWAVQAIAIAAAVLTLFSVNGKLEDLETRVSANRHAIEQVKTFDRHVHVLDRRVKKLNAAVNNIKHVKNDILEAVGDAIRRHN